MKLWKLKSNTIQFKLIVNLFYLLIPLLLLLIYNNTYVVNATRLQLANANHTLISLYLDQIDSELNSAEKQLIGIASDFNDLTLIGEPSDENSYVLAQARILLAANAAIARFENFDGFFVYSPYRKEFITASIGSPDYEIKDKFFTYIQSLIDSGQPIDASFTGEWSVLNIDQKYILSRLIKINEVYVGAWLHASSLLKPLSDQSFSSSSLSSFVTDQYASIDSRDFFLENDITLDDYKNPYTITGTANKYLTVMQASKAGKFSLVALTPISGILYGVPYLKLALIFFMLAALLFIPIYQFQLRRIVIKPIRQITLIMNTIRDGQMDVRIQPTKASEEFMIMDSTFNNMLDEIDRLKSEVYEEKINRQKAELKHLQGQVNPHFYLNSLNIMYTMARTGEIELLKEMCKCLIEYFRYMFRSNTPFVSLAYELEHVRNYTRIQQLRFPGKVALEIECPTFLESFIIPPLMIHSFVENTIKYAIKPDESVAINISIGLADQENVRVTISDTGKGFDPAVLAKLKAGSPIIDSRGEHIGIDNVRRRLSLLYKNNYSMTFDNLSPKGAVVEIVVPLDQSDLNEEGSC